ncbi:flagellin [Tardiphaga sp. 1201_B9_N1_1]|jgi:flagellin|uniref:flagellin n=1 Tax=Tardiphaga TaxID=1395974 RepID=UPI0008A7A845|nr:MULTISPECIES: flagellin [Tardiphaga]NUU45247.1 flagellin [Tardiphaga robiniae]UFS74998.1 flagellin [Tardiphaga sp. 37S4]SEH58804.1 flagellin [Tardiphaga sp. OK245]SNT56594.1 flagellin [Tardiphaga sp. OK246]
MPVISTNTAANSAVRYLNINSSQMSSSLSKLSSGSKITQASDDAAGLAISTRISSDVTTLQQAATNASQATSILQTADGGASNISDILSRMKSLASQSSSATVTDSSRAYLNSEFTALSDQIDSIATGTRYSGQSLLDGTSAFAAGASVLVGSTSADTITVKLDDLTSATLGVDTLDVSTQAGATAAIDALDTAIDTVSAARATIGAQESRFNFSASSISTQSQNLQAANSAITDVDIAAEQAKLSSSQVKVQAAVAAESSANQMPQYLLKLLG